MTLRPLLLRLTAGRQTQADLAAGLHTPPEALARHLDTLMRRELVDLDGDAYGLTAHGLDWLAHARRPGPRRRHGAVDLPAAAWRWLRMHRKGTVNDMLTTLAEADQPSAGSNLQRYLRALAAAGYVQRVQRGNAAVRWLLVRDTGRHAPLHRRRDATVTDPNTGEVHALEAAHG